MPLSRIRVRLSAAFALAFALGLAVLILGLFLVLRRDADRLLTRQLHRAATDLADAVSREYGEMPGARLAEAAHETFREWPTSPYGFVIYDGAGGIVATHGQATGVRAAPTVWHPEDGVVIDRAAAPELDFRLAADEVHGPRRMPFRVLAIGARQPTEEHVEALGWWMAASAPLVVLLSLGGGYALARLALRPIGILERAVAALAPADLARRLPVGNPPDELDRLALRFNELLDRLEEAQLRNRRFIQRAAHQLKTPLTVVLGEADLSLNDPSAVGTRNQGMRRVHTAARQMRRRVEELLLLAEAQAGEQVALDDLVELDGLVLECADLMRGRAAQTYHALTLGEIEPVTVRGSDRLLREALVELIENACRHGDPTPEIRVSVSREGSTVRVDVSSGGSSVPVRLLEVDPGNDGMHLGLTIVRWIAAQHGGRLRYERQDGINVFGLGLPGAPG